MSYISLQVHTPKAKIKVEIPIIEKNEYAPVPSILKISLKFFFPLLEDLLLRDSDVLNVKQSSYQNVECGKT